MEIHHIKRCKPLLGTFVSVEVRATLSSRALSAVCDEAFAEIKRIQRLMSFHDPDSELSFINCNAAKRPCRVSSDMHRVIRTALTLSRISQGHYDIAVGAHLVSSGRLPRHTGMAGGEDGGWQDIKLAAQQIVFRRPLVLDLGGIAKGYAVDCAFHKIVNKVENLAINAGGDCRMKHWKNQPVAIRASDPHGNPHRIQHVMKNSAVATSADYYAQNTFIAPHTKQVVQTKHSATVFANTCMSADALTKVALLHPMALTLFDEYGVEALTVDTNGRLGAMNR